MDYILDAQLDFLYNRQERLIIKQSLYMKLEYSLYLYQNPLSENFALFSSPSLTDLVFEDDVNHRIYFVQPFEYNCVRADFSGTKLCLNE